LERQIERLFGASRSAIDRESIAAGGRARFSDRDATEIKLA
jgi:hypothetical protein